MIRSLRSERGLEKTSLHNAGVAATHAISGTSTPSSFANASGSFSGSRTPDYTSGADEAARLHRDKLLTFQSQNTQRTKIHDEAADFDANVSGKGTQWMTPLQRAAALKKQQRYMKGLEELGRPEWERNRTVVSLGVKGGKVVRTFSKIPNASRDATEETDVEDEEVEAEEAAASALKPAKGGRFSDNPLLKGGGLIRPVWKAREGEEKGKGKEKRQSIWRRVQDENEDNEQWILDGGLRGYGTESRMMVDGNQMDGGG